MRESEIGSSFVYLIEQFWEEQGTPGEFTGEDGIKICFRSFKHPEPKKTIVFLTGRAEASVKYAECIHDFYQSGCSVFIMDHRGQGFSGRCTQDPQVGHVETYEHYAKDVNTFVNDHVIPNSKTPRTLIAHSMGCVVASLYLIANAGKQKFDRVVFSAPMFQINTGRYPAAAAYGLASLNCALGRGMHYAPGQYDAHLNMPFEKNDVTHSKERFQHNLKLLRTYPGIALGGVSNRWVQRSFEAKMDVALHAHRIDLPVLVLLAGADLVVRELGIEWFCEAVKECKLIRIPGAYHELLMETDEYRDSAITEIEKFMGLKQQ